ncbi:carbonic anhydrase [Reichenbachiella versicolor]|uniref:carbonic anhydrase n=1 Tax=Reichenbachiella versicolor TaxID=1821036 RepID=UPI0013A536BD|nr:carbonic anhydrase family protein [Reichenbachiella versicolor]
MNKILTPLLLFLSAPFIILAQEDQGSYNRKQVHHEWSYSGQYGPDHWTEIDPDYVSCGGTHQSPINIVPAMSIDAEIELEFHYHPFFVDLINNGHTLIERVVEPKALVINGEPYSLLQFHFHTPSEHHVNDGDYPMEIHFVHQNAAGVYAVLGVLVEYGDQPNPFLTHFMKSLPTHINEELKSFEKADPTEVFPKHFEKFFFYEGSLTTPPCTEGIKWIVLEEPVQATFQQIEAIHQIIHDDNRPIQEVNDRVVYHAGY